MLVNCGVRNLFDFFFFFNVWFCLAGDIGGNVQRTRCPRLVPLSNGLLPLFAREECLVYDARFQCGGLRCLFFERGEERKEWLAFYLFIYLGQNG
jgi:hypothetical protein